MIKFTIHFLYLNPTATDEHLSFEIVDICNMILDLHNNNITVI